MYGMTWGRPLLRKLRPLDSMLSRSFLCNRLHVRNFSASPISPKVYELRTYDIDPAEYPSFLALTKVSLCFSLCFDR